MVRDFNIEISSNYGWEIDIKDFIPPYRAYKPVMEAPISFGICVKKSNKLIAMYDPSYPSDKAIDECKKLPIFQEECNFYDEYNEYKFKGTFVDALIYIKKQYKENKAPTLEMIDEKKGMIGR